MASIRFSLAFAETCFTIDGNRSLHLVIASDEAATASILYAFDVTLKSTNGMYSHTFSASMPEGSKTLTIPFAVPLEWANDFSQNIGDTAFGDACGQFHATMTVHYTMYAGTLCFQNDYRGYEACISGTVAESIQPTAGRLAAAAVDGRVPAAWGVWVQGISTARISVTGAAGAYGSKIVAYTFGSGGAQTEPCADIPLKQSGNVTIPMTVQDSRGRTATADIVLSVLPYSAPSLTEISSHRCDSSGTPAEEGNCFNASCRLAASALGGHNAAALTCAWKKVTDSAYGAEHTISPGGAQILAAQLEKGASYDVRYRVSDAFYTIDYYDYVSSTVYLLHFLKGGTGIAVGKAAEEANLFDVALNTKMRRDLTVGGSAHIAGGLTLAGEDVGAALQEWGTLSTGACTLNKTFLPSASENSVVKCGRMMLFRLHGTMQNGSSPTYEGETYLAASLPSGFFSRTYRPLAIAYQNGKACKADVDENGKIYVIPTVDGNEDTEIMGIGIV